MRTSKFSEEQIVQALLDPTEQGFQAAVSVMLQSAGDEPVRAPALHFEPVQRALGGRADG